MSRKRSRKLVMLVAALVVAAGAGAYGFVVMSRPKSEIAPSRLARVERGDIAPKNQARSIDLRRSFGHARR